MKNLVLWAVVMLLVLGGWVYEVTAKRERGEKYGGSVYYGFYTE